MTRTRILLSATGLLTAVLAASPLLAGETPCAANYRSDGKSAETFVMTTLTRQEVMDRLPRKLAATGVAMQWTEPSKGIIKATGLDVTAEKSSEDGTRVVFRSTLQPPATSEVLCRYAALAAGPPVVKKVEVPQDAALIARLEDDLLKRHQIIQPAIGRGLNNAAFLSLSDFFEFVITEIKTSPGKLAYSVSMLLPRSSCGIAIEDLDDSSLVMNGKMPDARTRPVRVNALLVYEGEGAASHLTDATIVTIASAK